jgi:drug/metabolite transporter (DMT)-like permease
VPLHHLLSPSLRRQIWIPALALPTGVARVLMEEEVESSSVVALLLVLVALVVVPLMALLVRGRWRRAVPWREEVRRLARMRRPRWR